MNYFEKIRYTLCRKKCLIRKKSKLLKLVEKSSEKCYDNFDIFYYFRNIKNLNLVKKCIFNREQNKFVNFISGKYTSQEKLKEKNFHETIKNEIDLFNILKNIPIEGNKSLLEELLT